MIMEQQKKKNLGDCYCALVVRVNKLCKHCECVYVCDILRDLYLWVFLTFSNIQVLKMKLDRWNLKKNQREFVLCLILSNCCGHAIVQPDTVFVAFLKIDFIDM